MKKSYKFLWLVFGFVLFIFSGLKHFLLGSSAWDLGIFEQFTWLISQGDITEISSLRGISPLQDHFSLLLFPIAFLYKFFRSTYTLLFLQSFALGSIPLIIDNYLSHSNVNNKLKNAILISSAFTPIVFLANIANFHPEVVATPFMLLAVLESTKRRFFRYIVYLFISLSAKKSQALFGIGISFYLLAKSKYRRSLVTFLVSLCWWLISSHFSKVGGDYIQGRLGYLGDNIYQIISTLTFSPWMIFKEAPPDTIFLYILGLVLPFLVLIRRVAFYSLLGTLPFVITNIISSNGTQRELYSQYSISILPFIILACIESVDKNSFKTNTINNIFYGTIFLTIIAFIGYSRIGYYQYRYFPRLSESIEFNQIKAIVPTKASVLTTDHLAAHFAARKLVHNIEDNDYSFLGNYGYLVLPKLRTDEDRFDQIKELIISSKNAGFNCDDSHRYFTICQNNR